MSNANHPDLMQMDYRDLAFLTYNKTDDLMGQLLLPIATRVQIELEETDNDPMDRSPQTAKIVSRVMRLESTDRLTAQPLEDLYLDKKSVWYPTIDYLIELGVVMDWKIISNGRIVTAPPLSGYGEILTAAMDSPRVRHNIPSKDLMKTLKEIRMELGTSLEDLADEMNVMPRMIEDLENDLPVDDEISLADLLEAFELKTQSPVLFDLAPVDVTIND